uniref:non-specific serine/threonine protein kinase n=1 Tax=Balaenoptera musculus TaxID=9771 RepID=A0A8C0I554_BALMU
MQGLTAKSAGKKAHIDDFEILHTIGEGTFGKVKLARHILTGTQVAVKVIKKRHQSFSSVQALFREVCSLKALNHPNIVKLLGVIDTEETFFVVMEYLSGGDMYRYLKIHGRMTEAQARGPFQQLVSALQHCHRRGIVHRDLKPLSLLFDSNMNIKLTDFGLSNKCDDIVQLDTICGTHPYAAPELFLGQSYSEEGPEQPGRPKARPPWLQVCPSTPTWVKLERLDCHSWGTSPLPHSSVFRVGGGGG